MECLQYYTLIIPIILLSVYVGILCCQSLQYTCHISIMVQGDYFNGINTLNLYEIEILRKTFCFGIRKSKACTDVVRKSKYLKK